MLHLYVDADACPVKQEIYRVAERYELEVTLVANSFMTTPSRNSIKLVVVKDDFDSADDWITDQTQENDIVITTDIPLASRCLQKKARVLSPTGRVFSAEDIGEALAKRELMSKLRDMGVVSGGPAPFDKSDRSRFLQRLDVLIQAIRKTQR